LRLGARGRGRRAPRPRVPRVPLDGRPRLAQGIFGGDPRRTRQPRRRHRGRTPARRRRGARRRLHLLGLPRCRGVHRDHLHALVPAGRTLRAPGTDRVSRRLLGAAGALALLTAPGWLASPYHLHVLIMAGIFAILASSLNLLLGYTGQLSLGHAAFFGIGAYASALLTLKSGWSFWLALPCAGIAAGLAGWAIGRLALKLR